MNTTTYKLSPNTNLSFFERLARIVVGATLVGITMTDTGGHLGLLALLPLFATYPMLTALTGADPIRILIENSVGIYRATHFVLGAILIGSVYFFGATHLSIVAVFPILGIYSALAAVIGRSPIAEIYDALQPIPYVETQSYDTTQTPEAAGTGIRYTRAA